MEVFVGVEPGSREELRELLSRRPFTAKGLVKRYLFGLPTEVPLSKEELAKKLNWDESKSKINERRIRLIRDALLLTMEGLPEQFAKVAGPIALFGLLIAFSLDGTAPRKILVVICAAAIIALWVQSPRLKIFHFRKRPDSGERVGAIQNDLDEYYYLYLWLLRREETLHTAEVLVFLITGVGILALGFVMFVV